MTPIERVMHAYELMANLTPEQQDAARQKVEEFLKNRTGSEQELAVQGLQFLRGMRAMKLRRGRKPIPLDAS
jgi:hypothetical protein